MMLTTFPGTTTLLTLAFASLVVYNIGLVVYRLYFHPLSRFPGPKLNAASLWVDFYYEVILEGQMTFKLKDWHDKYGPIVRINPDELHILDPEFYEEIYTSAARPRDKWPWWYKGGGLPGAAFNAYSHELHRMRRTLLNPFFSKKTILQDGLPIVRSKLAKLLDRLRSAAETRDVIRMDTAFMALTMDIITSYSLHMETDYLDEDDFHKIWQDCTQAGFQATGFSHHFGWLNNFMKLLPVSVMLKLVPLFGHFLLRQQQVRADIDKVWYEDETKSKLKEADAMARPSIIHTMRDAEHLPPSELHPERVVDETFVLLSAGSETTAHMLGVTCYHLLTRPQVLSTLRAEILNAMSTAEVSSGMVWDIPYATLENLPYLSACVNEGLRTSHGVLARLPRQVSPSNPETLRYKDWEIPRSAVISMAGYYMVTDPKIFPDPQEFRPERWLLPGSDEDSVAISSQTASKTSATDRKARSQKYRFNISLTKYLSNFGKGTRACLGISLAYLEIYVALATLVVHVLGEESDLGMELYGVEYERDVKLVHDFFTAFPSKDSKGVRMRAGKGEEGERDGNGAG